MLNKEYLRCFELLERNDLVLQNLKFRLLAGRALFNAGKIPFAIQVLEKDPPPEEIGSSPNQPASPPVLSPGLPKKERQKVAF